MGKEEQALSDGKRAKAPLARRLLRWLLVGWLLLLLVLIPVLTLRTLSFQSQQPLVQKADITLRDSLAMAHTLAQALRFQTISDEGSPVAAQAFFDLHEHLRVSFPKVHTSLVREQFAEYSLLYTWKGSNPKLPPVIVAAHLDVVPAQPGQWAHPPYAGTIADGYIYGRGALDDKVNVLGVLEAAEQLLSEGFVPKRDLYFAFGHDEELGGYQGAQTLAAILAARGVHAEAIIDEGLVVTEGILDGLSPAVALIGIAEKGFANIELRVQSQGGHSSMPPKTTAIGRLSTAVSKLEAHPMPASLGDSTLAMFRYLGPEFSYARKLVMANLWLFGPLVKGSLTQAAATSALVRTTTAPTILQAGIKSNVLAQKARAVVNFRIRPGDTVEDILRHVRKIVADPAVEVKVLEQVPPQEASSINSRVFGILQTSIREIDPSILVAPGLMLAMTDSRHYQEIVTDIYRFSALRFGPEDLARLHGIDERVSIDNYVELVGFQLLLLRAAGQ